MWCYDTIVGSVQLRHLEVHYERVGWVLPWARAQEHSAVEQQERP